MTSVWSRTSRENMPVSHNSATACFIALLSSLVFAVNVSRAQEPGGRGDDEGGAGPYELLKIPQTPEELWDAAKFMFTVGQLEQARGFLTQLLGAKIPAELLRKIGESEDYGVLARMKNSPMLREPALELLRRVETAVRAHATDPNRIRKMIGYLHRSPAHRSYAIEQLRAAGADAVPLLIAELTRLPQGPERARVVQAMTGLSDTAIPPLLAVLDSRRIDLVTDVLYVLGHIGNAYTARVLRYYAEAETVSEAVRVGAKRAIEAILRRSYKGLPAAYKDLTALAEHHFKHEHHWLPEPPDGMVRLWRWSETEGLQARRVSPEYADLYLTVQFARRAYELWPSSARARALVIAAALELVPSQQPVAQLNDNRPELLGPVSAAALGGEVALSQALALALQQRRIALAETILTVWAEVGRPDRLFRTRATREVIRQALYWPDARLRLAALELALRARPSRAFPGSSGIVRSLAAYLSGAGHQARWFVVSPHRERAEQLAGLLREMGQEATLVSSVGELGRAAVSVRTPAILLMPPFPGLLNDVVARLRLDPILSVAPVVVLLPADQLTRWRFLTNDYPGTVVAAFPEDVDQFKQLQEELARVRRPLDDQAMQELATRAADWLVTIARGEIPALSASGAQDILIAALRDPVVGLRAVEAVSYLDDPGAQAALLELVVDSSASDALRTAAARAARFSIRRHGLLVEPAPTDRLTQLLRGRQELGAPLYRELVLLAAALGGEPSFQREVLLRFTVPRYHAPAQNATAAARAAEQQAE